MRQHNKKVKNLNNRKLKEQHGDGLYQSFMNLITTGENKLRDNEIHQPILDYSFGKGFHIKNSEFSGPHTQLFGQNGRLQERKQQGKKFKDLDPTSIISAKHDLSYMKAKNDQDIIDADKTMLKQLYNKSSIFHPLDTFNNAVAAIGIGSKLGLQYLGVKPSTFTDSGGYDRLNKEDKKLFDDNWNELQQLGYGRKGKLKRH